METATIICGVPLYMDEQENCTVLRSRWAESLTPIHARLLKGWLEHKGNAVIHCDKTIRVQGRLTDTTVQTK